MRTRNDLYTPTEIHTTQPRGVVVKHACLWNPRRQFESARGYPDMHARARLALRLDDVATARAVQASVALDDEGYIRTDRRGATLTGHADADSPMSLLHTLDDWLACVSVAERTAEAARPPGRTRRPPDGTRASRGGSSQRARRRTGRRRATR